MPPAGKATGKGEKGEGSMFITQRAQVKPLLRALLRDSRPSARANSLAGAAAPPAPSQVSGQKMHKAVKLPKIDSAKGVEPVTQSSQSTELLLANKEMTEPAGASTASSCASSTSS